MSDLELEKQEIERLEQELEMKKQQMEFKRQELVQQELYAEQNQPVVPEYQYEVEVVENQEIQTTDKSNEPKFINKQKIAIILSIVCFLAIPFFNQYFAKERQAYYDSIPLIIEDVEQYYDLTFYDIIDMYGQPDEHDRYLYDMGDYELNFSFEHGFVSYVSYDPKERFIFKNPKDAFYLFGLEDKAKMYRVSKDRENVYRCVDNSYIIDTMVFGDLNSKDKTSDRVSIFFKEHYPDREVFEGDFTKTQRVYNLIQYFGMNQMSLYNLLGKSNDVSSVGSWSYNTNLGVVEFYFNDNYIVDGITFSANEPIPYETSTQEIMVMFGVNPYDKGIQLVDYAIYRGMYFEEYENVDSSWTKFHINEINVDDKTFSQIRIKRKD